MRTDKYLDSLLTPDHRAILVFVRRKKSATVKEVGLHLGFGDYQASGKASMLLRDLLWAGMVARIETGVYTLRVVDRARSFATVQT